MKYNFYDPDNVRRDIKRIVQLLNEFYDAYGRMPLKNSEDKYEANLSRKWYQLRNKRDLNEQELNYIKENSPTEDGLFIHKYAKDSYIKISVKNFIAELNDFVYYNRRMPVSNKESEKHFFEIWYEFSKPNTLNDAERKYIADNMPGELKIRQFIVDFVNAFNEFVITNKRVPNQKNGGKENTLYYKWNTYKNLKLSTIEKEYVNANLLFFPITPHAYNIKQEVRIQVIDFVREFNEFVTEYKRLPSASFKNKSERSLWSKYFRYTVKGEVSEMEKEYIKQNLKSIEIRQSLMDAVQNYNKFIETYKRKPQFNGTEKNELSIVIALKKVISLEDLTEQEKKYIKYELNRLYFIRCSVIDFLKEYKDFKAMYKREPISTVTDDNFERNLAIRIHAYKSGIRKLNRYEIDYLEYNGFMFDYDTSLKEEQKGL